MAAEGGIPILTAEVENRVPFAESLTMGQTIFEWAPQSPAAHEIQSLTKEILSHGTEEFRNRTQTAKQPTDEQIAAFERGGTGHDKHRQRASKPTAAPAKTEPTKRLSLDLPQSLHTRFKTACSATRRKMVNELQTFIATRTKELEKEAGITHK